MKESSVKVSKSKGRHVDRRETERKTGLFRRSKIKTKIKKGLRRARGNGELRSVRKN